MGYFSAHVPILGVDIWEHVRVGLHGRIALLSVLLQAFYLQVSLNGRASSRSDRCRLQSITMSRPR